MASVVVLIGHYHQVSVAQALRVLIVVVELQTEDLNHILGTKNTEKSTMPCYYTINM